MLRKIRYYLRAWYINRYYRPNTDKWKAIAAASLVFCLWAWAMNEDYKDQMIHQEILKESYMKALLSCINGDGRFIWGNEIFECRGGSLGKI